MNCLFFLVCLIGSSPADEAPRDLLMPPAKIPADMPKLAPLLADSKGGPVRDRAAWEAHRGDLQKAWFDFIGRFPRERAPLKAETLDRDEQPAFVREHIRYQIEEGVFTDGYLLKPRGRTGKLPAAVVFHATANSQARQSAGLDPEKPELHIGVQLAERGFVTLCPRCYIFDEGADYAGNVIKMRERHPDWKGMTRMAFDAVRAADYLASLPEVDPARIGCIGHSLGAKEALYAAAFDERYRAAVFSEGGIGFSFSNWDALWYLGVGLIDPGADLEHHQLIAMIAPRPFLLLAGESADNDRSWAFIDAARPVYKLLGAEGNLGWLNHRQGHKYAPEARTVATEFLERHLKPTSPPPPRVISRGEAAGTYQAFPDACRLQNGDLLCVFYAGYGHISLPKDGWPRGGRVSMVRSKDEGRSWSIPEVLFDGPDDDRDPHIAAMRSGSIVVSFFPYRHPAGKKTEHEVSIVESHDGGRSWGKEHRVLAPHWATSAPVREMPDGTRLLGVYREEGDSAFGGVLRSTDGGKTWSDPIPIGKGSGVRLDAETDFILLKDGTLFAALRGDRVNLHFATSPDLGLTWSGVKDSGFKGHCPHFTRLKSGEILLTHRLPRTAMHVSRDEGKTWQGPIEIDATIGAYPSTVELKDGTVLVVYYEEGEGSAIRARRFRLKESEIEFLPLE